jgi:hypothetical protein
MQRLLKATAIAALSVFVASALAFNPAGPVTKQRPGGIPIANRAALDRALASAKGGETFLLADGYYGGFDFRDKRFDTVVTIQGGRGARFTEAKRNDTNRLGLKPGNLRNLTFRGITISGKGGFSDGYAVLDLSNTDGLTFDGIQLANTDSSGFGLFLRARSNNRNFKLINSEITKLKYGAVMHNGTDVLIKNNDSHHLRNDHIQMSGTTNVTIEDNIFRDSAPVKGDHPDIIQMTGPTVNTTIRRNKASGQSQGFTSHSEKVFQTNLIIEDNDLELKTYTNAIRTLNGSGRVARNRIKSDRGVRERATIRVGGDIKTDHNRID